MVDLKKENDLEREGVKTSSKPDEKHQFIFDELSEFLDKTGGDYGPFLMKELQRRLEFVIKNFNEELKSLIEESFKKWKIKDSNLRDLMEGNKRINTDQKIKENPKDSSTPDFIKDVKFGPIRTK